jgi:heme A synthase
VGAVPLKRNRWEEKSMHKLRLGLTLAASAAALAAMIAIPAIQPADAQQRKSIRWSTSNVDSYGYKVAAR